MAKQYAVYHVEKGAVSSGGIGNHIDRMPRHENTYPHADPERLHLNEHFTVNEHCDKVLHTAILDRIKEGYSAKNKAGELKEIRKDAVKYQTHIMTGTHEQMKVIENDPQMRREWISRNLEFLKAEYGEKNIVRFNVHRDEKTMHIHAVTVPLTEDGRLSAKEITGNRKAMQERQNRYHEQMKSFGLERGEMNTGVKHEDAREYYGRMQKALDSGAQVPEDVKKAVLGVQIGIDKEKTIENLKGEISAQKTAIHALQSEIQMQKRKTDQINERKKIAEKERAILAEANKKGEKEMKELAEKAREIIRSTAFSQKFRESVIENEKKKTLDQIHEQINNSKNLLSDATVANLIQKSMKNLSPENSIMTFQTHFGDKIETEIYQMAKSRNAELEKEQNQEQKKQQNRGFSR